MIPNYQKNNIVNHLLRSNSWSKDATLSLALFLTAPDDDGLNGVEASGTYYTRIGIISNDANWTEPADGISANANTLTFNAPGSDWGTVEAVCLMDDNFVGSGNVRFSYALPNPITVNNGDPAVTFPPGTIQIGVD